MIVDTNGGKVQPLRSKEAVWVRHPEKSLSGAWNMKGLNGLPPPLQETLWGSVSAAIEALARFAPTPFAPNPNSYTVTV